jgi:hypothetical protein
MDGHEPESQNLIGFDEVPDYKSAIVPAGIAITGRIDWLKVLGIFGIPDDQLAEAGHSRSVARDAGGQNTIKHINAPDHPFDQGIRRTYPHQIPGFILGQ